MAEKLEWLEADDWQRETLTEFTIGQAEKPHNDIATVWFDAGATVSTTREEAAELARMFAAAPEMFEALERAVWLVDANPTAADAEIWAMLRDDWMDEVRAALSRAKGDT